MAAAERMPDDHWRAAAAERRSRHLEQREVLSAAIQQDLIAEAGDDGKAEHLGIEALGARKIAHLDAKMIEPLQFHRGHRIDYPALGRCGHRAALQVGAARGEYALLFRR